MPFSQGLIRVRVCSDPRRCQRQRTGKEREYGRRPKPNAFPSCTSRPLGIPARKCGPSMNKWEGGCQVKFLRFKQADRVLVLTNRARRNLRGQAEFGNIHSCRTYHCCCEFKYLPLDVWLLATGNIALTAKASMSSMPVLS